MKTVTAVYPDKSKYTVTLDELKEYLKDEDVQWQEYFFGSLYDRKWAYGPIAKYLLNQ